MTPKWSPSQLYVVTFIVQSDSGPHTPFLVPKVMTWGQSQPVTLVQSMFWGSVQHPNAFATLLSHLSCGVTVKSPQPLPYIETLPAHKHTHAKHIPLWAPSSSIMLSAGGFSFCWGLKRAFLLSHGHLKPALLVCRVRRAHAQHFQLEECGMRAT